MPKKMRELFRIRFEDNGKDLLKLLKHCREKPLSQFKALNCEQERITKKVAGSTATQILSCTSLFRWIKLTDPTYSL